MAKLVVVYGDKTIRLDVPDGADVSLNLTEDEETPQRRIHPDRDALRRTGPTGRKLYRWLVKVIGVGKKRDIDPLLAEDEVGLVPIALGRTLASLERAGLVEIVHRRRDESSRICSYKIVVRDSSFPIESDDEKSNYQMTLEDIESSSGAPCATLFETICKECVDGQLTELSLRALAMKMNPVPSNVPTYELNELEKGDWIHVIGHDPLTVKVVGWGMLKDDLGN